LIVAGVLVLRVDLGISSLTGATWIELSTGLRAALVYTCLLGGWVIWAAERAFYRNKFLNRLKEAFSYCGLEANRKFPSFIEDVRLDDYARKLKLLSNGLPLKKFVEQKENLEGHLNINVVRIYEEPNDKSRINVVYAMKSLPSLVHMEDQSSYRDCEVPIGQTFEGQLHVNMRDVPGILVSGQPGTGKSNFLKIAASTLTTNNPDDEVHFLDFKGGMELADLTNTLGTQHRNFHFKSNPGKCAEALAQFGAILESRLSEIAKSGSATFDDYLKSKVARRADGGEIHKDAPLKRQFIIIDEIAQLYMRDPQVPKETLLKARDAVNRIARQGRAAAVYMIVATQIPNTSSFDQTVKANMAAVLCFPMPSHAASVSALGSKRAFDLNPDTKGRAVWKYGPKVTEVQTYAFL
jgi:hypothetical protein